MSVVIPALDEAEAIGRVLADIPSPPVDRVVVVDNGSSDDTGRIARGCGAEVLIEPRRGYGRACLAGLARLAADPPEVVVFLDADYSDDPRELPRLLEPIRKGQADLVCGSRVERAAPGALSPHARLGNHLATWLIAALYGHRYRDLGPFRAVRWEALQRLGLREPAYGWNVEMQVKALLRGLRVAEVPVGYRPRVGRSKISGTVRGSLLAGLGILRTILALRLRPGASSPRRR